MVFHGRHGRFAGGNSMAGSWMTSAMRPGRKDAAPLSRNDPGLVSGPEQIFADDGGDDHERTKNHGDKIAVFHGASER